MLDSDEHIVDRVGKRLFGTVVGLVLGLAVGLVVAALTVGSGSTALFVGVVVGVTLAGGVVGCLVPTPFLVMAEILLGLFT